MKNDSSGPAVTIASANAAVASAVVAAVSGITGIVSIGGKGTAPLLSVAVLTHVDAVKCRIIDILETEFRVLRTFVEA